MKSLVRAANRPLVSDGAVLRAIQVACFAAAVAVFGLSVSTLSSLGLSGGDLLTGLLAAAACAVTLVVLGVVLGVVLPLAVPAPKASAAA